VNQKPFTKSFCEKDTLHKNLFMKDTPFTKPFCEEDILFPFLRSDIFGLGLGLKKHGMCRS